MNKIKSIAVVFIVGACVCVGLFVKEKFFDKEFFYAGTLEATCVVIPSRTSSQLLKFPVKEGDRLKKGQVIAHLDDADLKISLANIESKYARSKTLFQSGRYPQSDLESLESEKNAADLKMKWCHIHSPIDGIVLTKYKEEGEWVSQGVGILSIANLKDIWAFFYVEQEKIVKLSLGQSVSGLLPEMPGKVFHGKIIKINSEPEFTPKNIQTRQERTRLVYGIKVLFENEDEALKPGMTIETKLD